VTWISWCESAQPYGARVCWSASPEKLALEDTLHMRERGFDSPPQFSSQPSPGFLLRR